MLEKEREKKEKESLRFQKIEGNYVPKNCISLPILIDDTQHAIA